MKKKKLGLFLRGLGHVTVATATTRAEAQRRPPLDRQWPGSRPSTPQSVANWTGLGRERVPLPRSSSGGVGGIGARWG